MTASLNPAAPHHLPAFIADPDGADVFITVMAVVLVLTTLGIELLFLRIYTLPVRDCRRAGSAGPLSEAIRSGSQI